MVLPFPLPAFVTVSSVILIESTNVSISWNITLNFLNGVPVFINSVTNDCVNIIGEEVEENIFVVYGKI